MVNIEKFEVFEIKLKVEGNYDLIEYCCKFCNEKDSVIVPAFKNKDNEYCVRFMPQQIGKWTYEIELGCNKEIGEFDCIENSINNHGVVKTKAFGFEYADETRFLPFGTTCYAWTSQPQNLQNETIKTLGNAPFNKIRMCVFPKAMPYNNNEPEYFPYLKDENGNWDINKPDYMYWENFDKRIIELKDLGIEADVILFHPYDRWGFSKMNKENSVLHLKYCIARLSAYRNIWWSLANEYEMLYSKTNADWDLYGETLVEFDIYNHLISNHNILTPYPKRDWQTHCSIQSGSINYIGKWREEYNIPVIIDECGYEGDLEYEWGNLSAFEMVHRFWWSVLRGGYCTHGETFHRDDEVLWWAKGGRLYGESAIKIEFLKSILNELKGELVPNGKRCKNPNLDPTDEKAKAQEEAFWGLFDNVPEYIKDGFIYNPELKLCCDNGYLQYFGQNCPCYVTLDLEKNREYTIEIIDIWEMTRIAIEVSDIENDRLKLPAKIGIAILVKENN